MMILNMTATFGKLQHETLELKPGLNVIEAPNEWGKSTWCAFLLAMLYGMDSRAKSTRTGLADKEHYAPWSGSPMSGRMEILWKGRKITIERRTRGRIPMGEFSAYETESGLPVTELTAANCGEILLGAEQSVFRRAGFIRLSDLPVTRDDALLKRLNALVTTGDESGDGEQLARELKALKNKCRYNKSGLLPQAEEELGAVRAARTELSQLQEKCTQAGQQLEATDQYLEKLANHQRHLEVAEMQKDLEQVEAARESWISADQSLQKLQKICEQLPPAEEARRKQEQIRDFSRDWNSLMEQARTMPGIPPKPQPPEAFAGMGPREAAEMTARDYQECQKLKSNPMILWILGAAAVLSAAVLLGMLGLWFGTAVCLVLAAGIGVFALIHRKKNAEKLQAFTEKYGCEDPEQWRMSAEYYYRSAQSYEREAGQALNIRSQLEKRLETLKQDKQTLCGEQTLPEVTQVWQEVSRYWDSLETAKREEEQARKHLKALESLVRLPEEPLEEDDMTFSASETGQLLEEGSQQRQQLLGKIGHYQGRMETIGSPEALARQQQDLEQRIGKLEQFQAALTIAQDTLEEAKAELQRRFAPRITRRAQELMGRMTGGRYERLTLGEDFSVDTGAAREDTLHSALWRSEGTADQLYLSLRLAVSEALTPEAPLVLDDALVRFDEERLARAMEILREEEIHKQVILFTCQDREGRLCPDAVSFKA